MRITSSGVGIGTTSPSAMLTVGATSSQQFLVNSLGVVTGGTWQGSPVGVAYGGTGTSTAPSAGQILLGNGTGYDLVATSTLGLEPTISILPVSRGGTGSSTLTVNGLLYGNGTNPVNALAVGTTGQVLWVTAGAPAWTSTSSLGLMSSTAIGFGNAGYMPFYSADGTNLTATSSLFISPSGKIGIGTTTPTQKLTVIGDIRAYDSTGTNYIQIGHNGTDAVISASTGNVQLGSGSGDLTLGAGVNLVTEGAAIEFRGSAATSSTITIGDTGKALDDLVLIDATNWEVATSGDLMLKGANRYLNFNATAGTGGYGLYDNGGTLQFKNSGGSWTNFGSGSVASSSIGQVAYYSANGSTVIGTSSIYIGTGGNIGIGTTSPSAMLTVGATSSQQFLVNNLGVITGGTWQGSPIGVAYGGTGTTTAPTLGQLLMGNAGGTYDLVSTSSLGIGGGGSGTVSSSTQGYIAYYGANGTTVSGTSSLFIASNGNIGVGTTSPTDLLTVGSYNSSSDTVIGIASGGTNNERIIFRPSGSYGNEIGNYRIASGDRYFQIRDNSNNALVSIGVGSVAYGNVGIGTTSAVASLDVYGNAILEGANRYLNFGTATGTGGYGFFDNNGTMQFKNSGGSWSNFSTSTGAVSVGTAGQVSYYGNNGDVVSGTSSLFIAPTGFVGIGTTTPGAKLTVLSTTGSQLRLAYDGSNYTDFIVGSDGKFTIDTNSSSSRGSLITVGDNSAEDVGLIFAGSSTPFHLALDDTDGALKIGTSTTIGSSTLLTITTAGYVGIGSTSPVEQLSLSGRLYVAGSGTSTIENNLNVRGALKVGVSSLLLTENSINSTGNLTINGITITPAGNMQLPSSNSLAIGTSTASAKLTVYGDAFLEGSNRYLNFGTATGTGGYGFRDLGGLIQIKHLGGDWTTIATSTGGSGTVNSGNTGYIPYYAATGTSLTATSSLFIAANGNIGIGTTNPNAESKLHITTSSWDANLFRLESTDTGVGMNFYIASGDDWSLMNISGSFILNNESDGERMRITDTGLVGIGTSSPSAKLTVWGTGTTTAYLANFVNSASTTVLSMLENGTVTMGNGAFQYDGTTGITSIDSIEIGTISFDTDAGVVPWTDMTVSTTSTGQLMSYTAQLDGNPMLTVYGETNGAGGVRYKSVGIGTTTPPATLSVMGETGSRPAFDVASSTGASMFRVLANGTVGIGTSDPGGYKLNVDGSINLGSIDGSAIYWSQGGASIQGGGTGNYLNLSTNYISRLYVDSTGLVGIGTSSPSAKLTVWGTGTSTAYLANFVNSASTTALSIQENGTVTMGDGAFQYDGTTGVTSIDSIDLGSMNFDTDSGIITWIDMPVATTGPDIIQSYTAKLDGNPLLTVYGVTDGAGGVQNTGIGIGTTTPVARLAIQAGTTTQALLDIASTTGASLFQIGANGAITTGTWNGSVIGLTYGGTGLNASAIAKGGLLAGTGAGTMGIMTVGTNGYVMIASSTATNGIAWVATSTLGITGGGGSGTVGSGLTGQVAYYNADGTAVIGTSSLFIASNGFIGIGTTSPSAPLMVKGSNNTMLLIEGNNGSMTVDNFGSIVIPSGQKLEFGPGSGEQITGNSSTHEVRILSEDSPVATFKSGRVGIGTTSPLALLDVYGNAILSGPDRYLNFSSATGTDGYGIRDNGGTMQFKNSGGDWTALGAGGGSGTVATGTAGQLAYYGADGTAVTGTSSIYVATSGFVGIGTTTPPTKLTVVSTTGAQLRLAYDGSKYVDFTVASNGEFTISPTGYTGGSIMTIGNNLSENVGMVFAGSSTPFYLALDNTDGNLKIGTSTTIGSSTTLTITPAGYVGIGTTSPVAPLSVYDNGGSTVHDIFVIATGTAGSVFRVNSAGQAFADNGALGTPADYAEYFKSSDPDLVSGEVVCIDVAATNTVKRCRGAADNDVIGIVSTKPLITGNYKQEYVNNPEYTVVAMLGQIPAKVSAENGPVRPGDSLTPAKQVGYIARAVAGDPTVGVALESLDEGIGEIKVLISRRNKSMTVEQVEQSVTDRIAAMKIEDEVRIMISSAVDSLDLGTEITPIVNEQIALLKSGLTVSVDDLNSQLVNTKADIALLATQVAALGQSVDLRFTNYDLRIEELNAKLASSTMASSQTMMIDALGNIKMGNNITNATTTDGTSTPVAVGDVAIVEIDALSPATALVVRQAGDGNIAEFQGPEVSVMTVEGGGDVNVIGNMNVDGRVLVCSGGVCPSGLDNSVDSTLGDVGVEGKVVAGAYESYCADGFVWVPGSSKYGTMPGFCVMDHIARQATDAAGQTKLVSDASSTPWVNISQGEAGLACQGLGDNYHLITENEWLTIAENAIRIGDNDINKTTAGLQLAATATSTALVMSNGSPVYDLVGTISQWTDQTITKTGLPALANSTPEAIGSWQEYYNVDDYRGLSINPPYYYTAANNGIGQILLGAGDANLRGFIRGYNGLYSLDLSNAPTIQSPVVGFRCAK